MSDNIISYEDFEKVEIRSGTIRLLSKSSILFFGKEKICEGPECTRTYMRIPNKFLTPPKGKRRRFRKKSIVKAEAFPMARNPAYKVWVNFSDPIGIKQTSAQITVNYTLDSLPGRQVMDVVNLGSRNIAGFESQFLLVGFEDEQGAISLATVDSQVPNGKKLR